MRALVVLPSLALLTAGLAGTARSASLEVMLRPAFGSAGDTSPTLYEPGAARLSDPVDSVFTQTTKPYGGGLALQAFLGVRITPWVSAGFMGGTRKSSATADDTHSDLARSAWLGGPYVRVYVPIVPMIEPWLSVGAAYVADTQTWKGPVPIAGGTRVVDQTLEHHGVAIPITLGADYKILPMLAAGLSFQLAPTFGVGGCYRVEGNGVAATSFCTDAASNLKVTSSKGYTMWSFGLNVRLTVPPT